MAATHKNSYEYDWEDEVLIRIPYDGLPMIFYRQEMMWRDFGPRDELFDRAIFLGQGCWERLHSIEEEEALKILKKWGYRSEE